MTFTSFSDKNINQYHLSVSSTTNKFWTTWQAAKEMARSG